MLIKSELFANIHITRTKS